MNISVINIEQLRYKQLPFPSLDTHDMKIILNTKAVSDRYSKLKVKQKSDY